MKKTTSACIAMLALLLGKPAYAEPAITRDSLELGAGLDELLASRSVRVAIPITGGSVTLPGIATVTFHGDAFEVDTVVQVAKTSQASVDELFQEFASIFRPSQRLSYEVVITTGILPPRSEDIEVNISLPTEFLAQVPADYGIELFAIVEQGSDLEPVHTIFELFESTLSPSGDALHSSIPGSAFFLDTDGRYKAVITLAPTPGVKDPPSALLDRALSELNSISISTFQCEAASIICPIKGGCVVTSPSAKIANTQSTEQYERTGEPIIALQPERPLSQLRVASWNVRTRALHSVKPS